MDLVKKNYVRPGLRGQWKRVNVIVLSWILNSMSKSLLGGVYFSFCAQSVWSDLTERFDHTYESRDFSLH